MSELHNLRLDKRNEVNHSKVVPDTSRLFTKTKDKAEVPNQAKIVELNPTPTRNSSFYNSQKVMGILRKNIPFSSIKSKIFSVAKHATDEKPKEYMNMQFINDHKNPRTDPHKKKRNLKERFISYSTNPQAIPDTPENEPAHPTIPNLAFDKADRDFLTKARAPRPQPMDKSTRQFFDTMLSTTPNQPIGKTIPNPTSSYKLGSEQGKNRLQEGQNSTDSARNKFLD